MVSIIIYGVPVSQMGTLGARVMKSLHVEETSKSMLNAACTGELEIYFPRNAEVQMDSHSNSLVYIPIFAPHRGFPGR